MEIIYTDITLKNQIKLNPEWFADFNWQNFSQGETVWMEDNMETNKPAALFCGIKDNIVFLYGVGYKIAYRNQVVN